MDVDTFVARPIQVRKRNGDGLYTDAKKMLSTGKVARPPQENYGYPD